MRVIHWMFCLLGMLLGLIFLAILLLFSVDFGRFKPQLESIASGFLNRPLGIDGPVHFTLGPLEGIKLSVEGLHLAGADWNPSAEIIQLGKLEATLTLGSLLQSPVVIDSIVVDGLHVRLEKDALGRGNWQFFDSMEAAEQEEKSGEERFRMPVWPAELSIKNSSIAYSNEGQAQPFLLEIAALTEEVLPSSQVRVSLDGALNQRPLAFTAESQTLISLITFRDVTLNVTGQLAELRLSGDLGASDLLAPYQPAANLKLTGPAIEDQFHTFGVTPITSGPLDLVLSLAPRQQGINLELTGALGEFTIGTHGVISDFQQFEEISLAFSAQGPNAGGITDLFVPDLLPNEPFTLNGRVRRSGTEFGVDALSARIGQSSLAAAGQISHFPRLADAEATLQLDIREIAEFTRFLAVPGKLEGPLLIDAIVQSAPKGGATLTSSASFKDMTAHIEGIIADTKKFVGSTVQVSLQGHSVQSLLQIMDVPTTSSAPVSLEAELERSTEGIRVSSLNAALGPDKLSATGMIGNDPLANASELKVALSGPALTRTLAIFQASADETFPGFARPYSLSTDLKLQGDMLSISDTTFEIDTTRMKLEGSVGLEPVLEQGEFTLTAVSDDILPLVPRVNRTTSRDTMPLTFESSLHWEHNLWSIEKLEALLGKASLHIAGKINGPPDFGKTDLQLKAKAGSLAELGKLTGAALPDVPISVQGGLTGNGKILSLTAFTAKVGASDLEGNVAYHYGEKPRIDANVKSDTLDLRPFLSPSAEPAADQPVSAANESRLNETQDTRKTKRVIPDKPFPLEFLDSFDANFDLDIQHIRARAHAVEDVVIRGSVEGGAVHLHQLGLTTSRGGDLKALAHLEPAGTGANLGVRVRGRSLTIGLPAENESDLDQLPDYSLDLAALGTGQTIRDLSESLTGYLRVVSGSGKVSSSGARMLTNDFLAQLLNAVNPYASKEPYADIRCATILAAAEDGRVYGEPLMVLQTDKLHIFARTEIELKSESLDLYFKTVPQEGLGISMANLINPYVMVSGTFAQPVLTLDGESAVVHGGAAILTGGLSILATGIADRYLSPKDPCGQSLLQGDAGLLELEKKHALRAAPKGWLPTH